MISSSDEDGHYLMIESPMDLVKIDVLLEAEECSSCESEFEPEMKVYYIIFSLQISLEGPICKNCINKKKVAEGLSN